MEITGEIETLGSKSLKPKIMLARFSDSPTSALWGGVVINPLPSPTQRGLKLSDN